MRDIVFLMENWKFIQENVGVAQAAGFPGKMVSLPHTWNAKDGQDGEMITTAEPAGM